MIYVKFTYVCVVLYCGIDKDTYCRCQFFFQLIIRNTTLREFAKRNILSSNRYFHITPDMEAPDLPITKVV